MHSNFTNCNLLFIYYFFFKFIIFITTTTKTSVLSTQESTNPTAPPRPPPPEIPKSPPKWPLRPGVLVHVKVDTKQNLCASRTQSPNTSTLNSTNVSYASPLLNASSRNTTVTEATGPIKTAVTLSPASEAPISRQVIDNESPDANDTSIKVTATKSSNGNGHIEDVKENNNNTIDTATGIVDQSAVNNANMNDELVTFTTSSLIERILGRLRWRRERSKPIGTVANDGTNTFNGSNGGQTTEESLFARSNRRAVNLLRATGWFGSGKSTNSSTALMFDKRHHITCSDGGN